MVPAYLEELAVIPTMTSGKADRKRLPPPQRRRSRRPEQPTSPPRRRVEAILAEVLAEILDLDQVVGRRPLLRRPRRQLAPARPLLRAGPRQRPELPPVAIKDVYLNPTIRSACRGARTRARRRRPARRHAAGAGAAARAGTCAYARCAARLSWYSCSACRCGDRRPGRRRPAVGVARDRRASTTCTCASALFVAAAFASLSVLADRRRNGLLVGRWRAPARSRCGARRYLRFWTVKTLIRTSPMVLFVGSPLYVVYLRALGARIGRGVTVFSTDRAGLHRPADHRRRHGRAAATRRSPATGPRQA